jgi:hypothetical protein
MLRVAARLDGAGSEAAEESMLAMLADTDGPTA